MPEYFHPRPSAVDYNAASSVASELLETVEARAADYAALNGAVTAPLDAVTASCSGLDPHISPANALAQSGRVAEARGADPAAVREVMEANSTGPWLGLFGTRTSTCWS